MLLAILISGCASSGPDVAVSRVPDAERDYLIDPASGYPLALATPDAARLREMFSRLTAGGPAGGDLAALEASALQWAESDPALLAARVLAGQAAFLQQRNQQALDHLVPVVDELPDYLAAALLAARAEERLARISEAFARFLDLAPSSRVAARRALDLRPRAVEIVRNRFDEALRRGRFDDAEGHLEVLRTWQGADDLEILEASWHLLRSSGDQEGELEVIRRLTELDPRPETERRRGELEIAIGEARSGLEIFERLATADPEDADLADWLARAKFLWRLELLPPEVQALGRQGELDRADLATLLYWLFPDVRYSRVDDPPIAADILEHPRRREILRVLDVDLLGVDEALHRFRPDEPASRQDLLASLLTLLNKAERPLSCLRDEASVEASSRPQSWVCSRAAECRLIDEPLACLPSATLAGPEALELVRAAQDLSGAG